MDKFINNFLKIYESNINPYADLPVIVHQQNIDYFKVLNYMSEMNIFDVLAIKIKCYKNEIIVKKSYNRLKCFTKGSRILSINGQNPFSYIEKCEKLVIRLNQKIKKNSFVCKDIELILPMIDNQYKKNEVKYNSSNIYIKINSFQKGQFVEYVFKYSSFDKVIIDLRDNMGGTLSDLIEFLECFFKKGEIIANLCIFGETYTITSKRDKIIFFNKLYLIVNKNTYSCSEILTHILYQKYGAAVIGDAMGGKLQIVKTYSIDSVKYMVPIGEFKTITNMHIYRVSNLTINKWLKNNMGIIA